MTVAMTGPMMATAVPSAGGAGGASAFMPQLLKLLGDLGVSFGMRKNNMAFGFDPGRGRRQSELAEILKILQQQPTAPPTAVPSAKIPVTTVGGSTNPTTATPSFSALLRPTGPKIRLGMAPMR